MVATRRLKDATDLSNPAAGYGDVVARGRQATWLPRVCILGTSITAQCTNFPAGGVQNQCRGYWTWAQILSGQRLWYNAQTDNYGVASDTIDLASARIPTIIAGGYDLCIIELGTNDIAITSLTYAQIQTKMTDLILKPLMRAGIKAIVCTVAPRGGMGGARQNVWAKFNHWLRDLSNGRPDLVASAGLPYPPILCDVVDYLEDKIATAVLNPITNYTRDQTHPTGLGAFWWGKALATVIIALYPNRPNTSVSSCDIYDATDNPSGNKTTRGALLGTGGGLTANGGLTPTGVVAAGWSIKRLTGTSAGAMVGAKENPRTDGPNSGERQSIRMTSPGSGLTSEVGVLELQSNITVVAGQQYYAECQYEITGTPVGIVAVQLHLTAGGGGVTTYATENSTDTSNVAAIPVAHKGVLRTPILTISSGNTTMNINPGLSIKADIAADATCLFSDVMIRQVVS